MPRNTEVDELLESEFGIHFPIRNEQQLAKALIEARARESEIEARLIGLIAQMQAILRVALELPPLPPDPFPHL